MTITPLTEIQCGTCGVWHAIPMAMYDKCIEEGGFWHCPNGHSRGYSEGRREREAVRRERDRLKQQLAARDDELRESRETAKRTEAAYKGQLTKIKNRAKAGVCACCNRTFQNLARHMASKHPDFDPKENVVKLEPPKRRA